MRLPYSPVTLRQSLETLEQEAITVRVLARSMADSTRPPPEENPLYDPDVRRGLAAVLCELAATVTTYGRLATEHDATAHDRLEAEMERHLAAAGHQQDRLGEQMWADPAAGQATWPLRGELISHLDRLGTSSGRASRDACPAAAAPALALGRPARGCCRDEEFTRPPCPAGTVALPRRDGAPGAVFSQAQVRGRQKGRDEA